MSKPRKSSAALAAREKARAKAEEITRRNEQLIELAAKFFIHEDEIAVIDEESAKKIAELQAAAQQKKNAAREAAAVVVQQMLGTGESKKSISERLGLSASELKSFLPSAAKAGGMVPGNTEDQGAKNMDAQGEDAESKNTAQGPASADEPAQATAHA